MIAMNGAASAPPPLAIETDLHQHSNGEVHGKRKEPEREAAEVLGRSCTHLPRDVKKLLPEKLRSSRAAKANWVELVANDDAVATFRSERISCLSCDFSGARENPQDHTDCFMTHAILTNHHVGLLRRKKQLFCARCLDFVYPDTLLELTQLATPSAASSASTSLVNARLLLLNRQRAPALRRRLLRSSARRGLVNMGNTCFMNSVLQALAHNPLLQHEYFVLRGHNTTICEQKRRQHEAGSGEATPCMGCEMSALMQMLFPAPRATLTARHLTSPVVPQSFLEAFWSYDKSFVGAHQQDAHEFLVSVLNGIHKHTFPRTVQSQLQQQQQSETGSSPRFTPTGQSLCDCVVHQNFAGVFASEVTCVLCDSVTSTYDPFLDVSLSLEDAQSLKPQASNDGEGGGVDGRLTLTTLMERFTAEERLKGKNQFYCRRCSRYVDATKQLVLHKLPNLLVLHLKRLDFHKQRKITEPVDFPLAGLDLVDFCSQSVPVQPPRTPAKTPTAAALVNGDRSPMTPPATRTRDAKYDLAAVICHHGDAVDGGHFTAFVHASREESLVANSDGTPASGWVHFDDCGVQPVAAAEVAASQAYLLFYVRRRLFT